MTGMADSPDPQAIRPLAELPDADSDLMQLLSAAFDGSATLADAAKLERLLESPSALAAYNAAIDVEAALRWRMCLQRRRNHAASAPVATSTSRLSAANLARASVALIAAWCGAVRHLIRGFSEGRLAVPLLLLALLAAGIGLWPLVGNRLFPATVPEGVATITALEQVTWAGPSAGLKPGDRLGRGAELSVAAGLVQVHHAAGARVVIAGPASYQITDTLTGYLSRGRLTATLEGLAGSFAVHTPSAVITDRGTQFGVFVGSTGTTEVQVLEGAVDLTSAGPTGRTTPWHLAAGEAAGIDGEGRLVPGGVAVSNSFITAVPTLAVLEKPPANLPFAWDEAAAATIYHEAFAGSEPLAGTTPASRGGVGDAVWVAPERGWQCNPLVAGLSARAAGTACLPFHPEPGFVYRLTVAFDVASGGNGWAAIGFATEPRPGDWNLDYAWMLQRHTVRSSAGRVLSLPNVAYAGPGRAGRIAAGDERTGLQVRTVMLDTTAAPWRAAFLVGDHLIGECAFPTTPAGISHVAVSLFPDTTARFRLFSLKALFLHPSDES